MTDYIYQRRIRELVRDGQGRPQAFVDQNLPHAWDAQTLFCDYFHKTSPEMLRLLQKHVSKKIVNCEMHRDYSAAPGTCQVAIIVQTPPSSHLSERKRERLWDFLDDQLHGEWGRAFFEFVWSDAAGHKFSVR